MYKNSLTKLYPIGDKKKVSRKGCKLFFSPFLNSLPNNKFLDWSKFRAFADDKLNLTEKLKFVLGKVENIVGKGENAGFQHFLLFPQCFQKPSFLKVVKSRDCVVRS